MLTSLPYVAVVLAVKLVFHFLLDFTGMIEFSDIGLVLTGGVFLIGFMLAGTMADYKESERLPAELACSLESLEEAMALGCAHKGVSAAPMREKVLELCDIIRKWFVRKVGPDAVFSQLTAMLSVVKELETMGAFGYAARAGGDLSAIRRTVTRISVISRTGFLSSGYALLETLAAANIALVLIAGFKNIFAEVILVSFVTLIFVYMLRLIRDIDDPFEYAEDGVRGAAEVELFPLEEYVVRLRARSGSSE